MRLIYVILMVIVSSSAIAKKRPDVKRGDKYFAKGAYAEAIVEYERLNRREKAKPYVSMQLAVSYDKLGKSVQVAKYYGQAIAANNEVDSDELYAYAQNTLRNGRYDVAKSIMKKYVQQAKADDQLAIDFVAFQDDLDKIKNQPDSYLIAESGVNDLFYDDFGLTKPKGDTVYFVSNRTKYESSIGRKLFEVKDKKTDKPNLALYQAEYKNRKDPLSNITLIEGKVNKRFNDGIASVNPKGDVLYFSSDSYRHRKFRRNKSVKKRNEMKSIFTATRKGKHWQKIKVTPFSEAGVIYTNPFVSPDGQYLYFSSNREGSIGKLDIWRVAILDNGMYGEPENLGAQVNRGGVEDYASVSTDNVLYFASDRWGGFGGLDVYAINLANLNAKATNLGTPINTAKDDYGFSFSPENKLGFISSNRIGREDVYRVYPLCTYTRSFKAVDKTSKAPIANATVVLLDDRENIIQKGTTDARGLLSIGVECGKYYQVQIKQPAYLSVEKSFRAELTGDDDTLELPMLSLQEYNEAQLKAAEVKIENNKIVLKDIEFGFDSATIPTSGKAELDKLVVLMKQNPAMRIQINAYTDNRGTHKYNMRLSKERALNTANYLFEQGIDVGRVVHEGYGTTKPKVVCKDCTDEQNAINRRSEFIILTR